MKVLIIDDNSGLAALTQFILELEGHEVNSASTVKDGYLRYLRFRPDLVITDIQMPGENGFELMDHIRKHDPTVKTIYMSDSLNCFSSDLSAEKHRYSIGCLNKPFSRSELIECVSELTR
jgi:DNA-binding NtrC family response regulator